MEVRRAFLWREARRGAASSSVEGGQEKRRAHRRRGSPGGAARSPADRKLRWYSLLAGGEGAGEGRRTTGGGASGQVPRSPAEREPRRGGAPLAEELGRVARLPVEGAREGGVLTRLGKGSDGSCGGEEDAMRVRERCGGREGRDSSQYRASGLRIALRSR
jgi:hypothetical protein